MNYATSGMCSAFFKNLFVGRLLLVSSSERSIYLYFSVSLGYTAEVGEMLTSGSLYEIIAFTVADALR